MQKKGDQLLKVQTQKDNQFSNQDATRYAYKNNDIFSFHIAHIKDHDTLHRFTQNSKLIELGCGWYKSFRIIQISVLTRE